MSLITIPWRLERPTPPFEGDEIRYPEGLVRHFLDRYTKRNAKVFDPFTGLGTTLFAAEDMGRIPYGVEANDLRFAWVAGQLENWQNVQNGDSAKLDRYHFPKMDFCMTSPPFMGRHQKWNPLFAGNPRYAGYDTYLKRMAFIFAQVAKQMKRGAKVVVHVDNLRHGRIYTPLVRDMGKAASASLTQIDEITVLWKNPRPGYDHTTCLVFTA